MRLRESHRLQLEHNLVPFLELENVLGLKIGILEQYSGNSHEVVISDGVLQVQEVTIRKAITFGFSYVPHHLQELLGLSRTG